METKLEKIARWAVFFALVSVFAQIIYWRPFFGLMDDAMNLLVQLPRLREKGVFAYAWEYAQNDITWGMFRPIYPVMMFLLYEVGDVLGPTAYYIANACFSVAVIAANAAVLSKIIRIPAAWILLFCSAFFYGYDLFQHPSLQEKLILLFGAGALWAASDTKLKLTLRYSLLLLFTLLGTLSKASYCIYIAASFLAWLSYSRDLPFKRRRALTVFLLGFQMGCVGFLARITSLGEYTSGHYSLAKILPNLLSRDGFMFAIPTALAFGLWLRKKTLEEAPERLLPVIGVAGFLAIFLPWGIAGYIQTVITPLFAALLAQLAFALVPAKKRWLWALPLTVLAVGVSIYRPYGMFARLGDLGAIVRSATELKEKGVDRLYLPCHEGSTLMGMYLEHFAPGTFGSAKLEDPAQASGKWLLYDRAMCPLPGRAAQLPGCREEIIYQSPFSRGYKVARQHCKS